MRCGRRIRGCSAFGYPHIRPLFTIRKVKVPRIHLRSPFFTQETRMTEAQDRITL